MYSAPATVYVTASLKSLSFIIIIIIIIIILFIYKQMLVLF